ncbi:MAG: hypothetical protein EOP40_12065 [Rubrivivax sp.]|nr:MAG: hypothetical protein EOP40_12065 [Rubrivivax sp.]
MAHLNTLDARQDTPRDPLTGATEYHPIGTGVGAAAGGITAGALMGSIAGPAGTLLGAAVGAVAGGLMGKAVADSADPALENSYWRDNPESQPTLDLDGKNG